MAKNQSVEPNIADLANGWLRSYKLPYKLEQESLNTEIDQALNDYASKSGGAGGNRPDAKMLLQDKNLVNYPILIEYKGYKDKLVLLDADESSPNLCVNCFRHNMQGPRPVLLLVLGTLWWGKAQNTIRIRLCGRLVSYFNKSRIRKRLFQNCIEPAL